MKKLIFVFIFPFLSASSGAEEVYICKSKGASKYHYKENCRGLSACKHEVVKITLKSAKDKGLTICGWED